MRLFIAVIIVMLLLVNASEAFAKAPSKATGPGKRRLHDSNFATAATTQVDFNETLIDGQMKAPQGFFLQGRNPQSLSQMVRLRANFARELRNSKAAAKASVK